MHVEKNMPAISWCYTDIKARLGRSKKDGNMSVLPECTAGIKQEYLGKDDNKQI